MVAIGRALCRVAFPFLFVALTGASALADGEVNVDKQKIAIKGYDPVAYFTEGKAVKGKPEFKVTWHDAAWLFSSAENRGRFKADPEKYSPRYGGFCALAVAAGQKVDIDPEAWSIVDGRLYLNYNSKFRDQWRQNLAENIRRADDKWSAMN